jgi:hypothetical protein
MSGAGRGRAVGTHSNHNDLRSVPDRVVSTLAIGTSTDAPPMTFDDGT